MKAICRDPELRTLRRTVSLSTRPSLCHMTEGGGEPSAWHRSVTEESTGAKYSRVSELITGGTSGARRNVWGQYISIFVDIVGNLNFSDFGCILYTTGIMIVKFQNKSTHLAL